MRCLSLLKEYVIECDDEYQEERGIPPHGKSVVQCAYICTCTCIYTSLVATFTYMTLIIHEMLRKTTQHNRKTKQHNITHLKHVHVHVNFYGRKLSPIICFDVFFCEIHCVLCYAVRWPLAIHKYSKYLNFATILLPAKISHCMVDIH